jgi:hypothetical protein
MKIVIKKMMKERRKINVYSSLFSLIMIRVVLPFIKLLNQSKKMKENMMLDLL